MNHILSVHLSKFTLLLLAPVYTLNVLFTCNLSTLSMVFTGICIEWYKNPHVKKKDIDLLCFS